MKNIALLIITAIICSGLGLGCKTGNIDLRFHPKDDSKYKLVFASIGKVSMSIAGKEIDTDIHTVIGSQLSIDSLADNKYGVTLTYEDYNMKEKFNGKEFDLSKITDDSAGSSKNLMQFLKGMSFNTILNSVGKTESVTADDSMINKLDKAMLGVPDQIRNQLTNSLRPIINDEMARGILEQCFYVFPDEKVSIGDKWKNQIVIQSMFSMIISSTYTLMELKDGIAKLKVHSIIKPGKTDVFMPGLAMAAPRSSTPQSKQSGIDLLGLKMKAEFDGTQEGNVWVNYTTGIVNKTELNQDLKGKISISILELPMQMKMTTTYTVSPL